MLIFSNRNELRLSGLLGLCVRARQCTFGEKACLQGMRSGEIRLLLMDETISDSAGEKYEALGARESIPVCRLPDGFLWTATGKDGMVMGIRSESFAEQVLSCLE